MFVLSARPQSCSFCCSSCLLPTPIWPVLCPTKGNLPRAHNTQSYSGKKAPNISSGGKSIISPRRFPCCEAFPRFSHAQALFTQAASDVGPQTNLNVIGCCLLAQVTEGNNISVDLQVDKLCLPTQINGHHIPSQVSKFCIPVQSVGAASLSKSMGTACFTSQ